MATTVVSTVDLSQAIADTVTAAVDGLRVYWYVSDAVRPPALIIGQPDIDYTDNLSGFCTATWSFPLTLVVARNNDRDAQVALSRYLQEVTSALAATDAAGVQEVEPVAARPIPGGVEVSGQVLPGYSIDINVRA